MPDLVAALFGRMLRAEGFKVELSDTLDAFLDEEKLLGLDQPDETVHIDPSACRHKSLVG